MTKLAGYLRQSATHQPRTRTWKDLHIHVPGRAASSHRTREVIDAPVTSTGVSPTFRPRAQRSWPKPTGNGGNPRVSRPTAPLRSARKSRHSTRLFPVPENRGVPGSSPGLAITKGLQTAVVREASPDARSAQTLPWAFSGLSAPNPPDPTSALGGRRSRRAASARGTRPALAARRASAAAQEQDGIRRVLEPFGVTPEQARRGLRDLIASTRRRSPTTCARSGTAPPGPTASSAGSRTTRSRGGRSCTTG
jgi:hypothetical protein